VKRSRRWLFNGFAALSMALCLATCVLWVRSYWYHDELGYVIIDVPAHHGTDYYSFSEQATINIGYTSDTYFTTQFARNNASDPHPGFRLESDPVNRNYPIRRTDSFLRRRGFDYWYGLNQLTHSNKWGCWVMLPHWFLALLSMILPSVAAIRIRRRKALAMRGHCHNCGYDLRATPDRCPECGTIPQMVS
jgi:hypothetical protein